LSESVILRVLVHGGETPAMAPLVAALAANAALEVISRPAADPLLPDGAHVVLAAGERPPDDAELRAVAGRGGRTPASWPGGGRTRSLH